MDPDGEIEGKITQATYTGESVDAIAQVKLENGKTKDLLVHIHPEVCFNINDKVNFKILPNFVAVVKHED